MSKVPGANRGTSGLMPVKGSSCGIRPDPDEMSDEVGFNFSAAADLLAKTADDISDAQPLSAGDADSAAHSVTSQKPESTTEATTDK